MFVICCYLKREKDIFLKVFAGNTSFKFPYEQLFLLDVTWNSLHRRWVLIISRALLFKTLLPFLLLNSHSNFFLRNEPKVYCSLVGNGLILMAYLVHPAKKICSPQNYYSHSKKAIFHARIKKLFYFSDTCPKKDKFSKQENFLLLQVISKQIISYTCLKY